MRRWRAGLPALGWEAAIADPPPLGEGDHAKHGGGAREVFPVLFIRNATPPVPLHHLRWSPSPCREGSAATGRNRKSLAARRGRGTCPPSPAAPHLFDAAPRPFHRLVRRARVAAQAASGRYA